MEAASTPSRAAHGKGKVVLPPVCPAAPEPIQTLAAILNGCKDNLDCMNAKLCSLLVQQDEQSQKSSTEIE
jgi:hypothetical protein